MNLFNLLTEGGQGGQGGDYYNADFEDTTDE